jgi:UDP-perosamine 4-acetyltransferase
MVKRVVGLGAGGHAKVVLEILRLIGGYEIVGLLDPKQELWGTEVLGVPVLGDDGLLSELYKENVKHAFIGLGTVGDTRPRRQLYEKACRYGFHIVRAIHPQAIVAASAEIGDGPTVMASAVVGTAVRLGGNVIVNTGAIIEHDCVIGEHVHIATGVRLASTVQVRTGVHIGVGATVRQGITIGTDVIVGAGAVVIRDVPPGVTVVGCPARILQRKEQKGEENG